MRWLSYVAIAIIGGLMADAVVKKMGGEIKSKFELVEFSTTLCTHCALFEQGMGVEYQNNTMARTAPIKYVNLDDQGTGPYHISKPISTVPTFIIMKDGKETARLTGLVDKFHFLSFVRDNIEFEDEIASK